MDTVAHYREIVRRVLQFYAEAKNSEYQIDSETIYDDVKGHYEVIHVGWQGTRRIHGIVIHIDIVGDKVWIQYNGTDRNIADELVEAGIPREAIVLAFHPPELRAYTGFAVA